MALNFPNIRQSRAAGRNRVRFWGYGLFSLALLAASAVQAHDANCRGLPTCQAPAKYMSGRFLQRPIIRIVSGSALQSICLNGIGAQGDTIIGCAEMTGTTCLVRI